MIYVCVESFVFFLMRGQPPLAYWSVETGCIKAYDVLTHKYAFFPWKHFNYIKEHLIPFYYHFVNTSVLTTCCHFMCTCQSILFLFFYLVLVVNRFRFLATSFSVFASLDFFELNFHNWFQVRMSFFSCGVLLQLLWFSSMSPNKSITWNCFVSKKLW